MSARDRILAKLRGARPAEPLPRPADDLDETEAEVPAANPFAALAALRKPN